MYRTIFEGKSLHSLCIVDIERTWILWKTIMQQTSGRAPSTKIALKSERIPVVSTLKKAVIETRL